MQYRSPPRPPPARSMAASATRHAYACHHWTGGAAGADLEVGRAGWLFRCRLCAAASSCGRAVTSAILPNGAFSYTTSLTPAVPPLLSQPYGDVHNSSAT